MGSTRHLKLELDYPHWKLVYKQLDSLYLVDKLDIDDEDKDYKDNRLRVSSLKSHARFHFFPSRLCTATGKKLLKLLTTNKTTEAK